jgi:hypothetical protein
MGLFQNRTSFPNPTTFDLCFLFSKDMTYPLESFLMLVFRYKLLMVGYVCFCSASRGAL